MLVIHRDVNDKVLHTYIVTSFRNNKDNAHWRETSKYCSLVNLETGYIAFEEPCSRNTTELRILRHLCSCCDNAGSYDYKYDETRIAGSYIREYKDYEIHLKTEN